mmetsp:Transcript_52577/g.94390  ORF Transcript_52577/g.94390 Transcript_52577/m.94390 type:complete len:298 (-) Transcript_52577:82-975(-)
MNFAELMRRRFSLAGRPTEVLQAHAEENGLVAGEEFQKHELVEHILSLETPVSASPGPLRSRHARPRPVNGASAARAAGPVVIEVARRRHSLAERPLEVLQAHAEECGLNSSRRLGKQDLIDKILSIEPASFQGNAAARGSGQAQLRDADVARRLQAEEEVVHRSPRREPSVQEPSTASSSARSARSARSEPYPTVRSPGPRAPFRTPRVAGESPASRRAPRSVTIPRKLQESTATMIYDGSSRGSSGSECSVCMEAFVSGQELRVLPCLHRYHRTCIDQWLRQKAACPLCKHDLQG